MARKLADLKAPVALVPPCAYEGENSEMRDLVGPGELLRAQDSVGGGKVNRRGRTLSPQSALKRQHVRGIGHHFCITNGADAPILAHSGDSGASRERANRREV